MSVRAKVRPKCPGMFQQVGKGECGHTAIAGASDHTVQKKAPGVCGRTPECEQVGDASFHPSLALPLALALALCLSSLARSLARSPATKSRESRERMRDVVSFACLTNAA